MGMIKFAFIQIQVIQLIRVMGQDAARSWFLSCLYLCRSKVSQSIQHNVSDVIDIVRRPLAATIELASRN